MEEKDGGIQGEYGDEMGDNLFEKESEDVENFMQDMEEEEMALDGLKLPDKDEDEEDDEEYGGEEGEEEQEEQGSDMENQVFADAREHGEMDLLEDMKK